MRLVLVHGINQQGRDPEELKMLWVNDLEIGLDQQGALAGVEVVMPFYGDVLADKAAQELEGVVQRGLSEIDDDELASFVVQGLEEQAAAAGITAEEIRVEQERGADLEVVEEGFPMNRRINAIASLLEKLSPLGGEFAMRFLNQAHSYLRRPDVALAVDEIVQQAINDAPSVVVAHSLGTLTSFKVLRSMAEKNQPFDTRLYVTFGSPLAISAVQRGLGSPFDTPRGIAHWMNVYDPDDFITLNRSLSKPLFSEAIENIGNFQNPGQDAHAIPGYLQCRPVAQKIAKALALQNKQRKRVTKT